MEWFGILAWSIIVALVGDMLWQIRIWIRAKATRELAVAKQTLILSGRGDEADKVKLP